MKKRIIINLLVMVTPFLFILNVNANNINSINMDIYIDKNGTAHIAEIWDAYLDQGTEGYKSYGSNMGNAKITNFKVSENNQEYLTLDSWNTKSSFNDKAYKSGINKTNDTIELCFGISKYGSHKYKLTYDIEGFVAETSDYQMVYWELVGSELSNLTDKVYIKIYADERFSDTLDIWGYGNYGAPAYVYDGYIEVSDNHLENGEYITVLIKFPKGTFKTNNIIQDKDFNSYYEMANEGANHYKKDKTSVRNIIKGILSTIVPFSIFIAIFIITIVKSVGSSNKAGSYSLNFGETGKRLPKEVNMFRDIPCKKDVYRAYWVACNYGLMKNKNDFLGTMLLKWLKEKHIKIESAKTGLIFKKDEAVIVFDKNNLNTDNNPENDLYKYMYEASRDGRLESKEFEKWCKNNYSTILKWFDRVLDYESDQLVKEGKLKAIEKTTMKIFHYTIYEVDPSMKEEAIQMKGLKEFFKYFKNMQDKEAIHVMLWEEYLMYAQIFGVAEEVAKQFKKLYPEMITDYNYNNVIFLHTISHTGMVTASTAKSRAESYKAGGGGFSSGGGGGGSFGGGGGGGFR